MAVTSSKPAILLGAAAFLVSSCASDRTPGGPPEITIDYDPATQTAADADEAARGECGDYGLRARFLDETADPSGRLRHRHYECF